MIRVKELDVVNDYIDVAVNKFLIENEIDDKDLIDIKYHTISNNTDMITMVLIVYRVCKQLTLEE